jgi:hypothetical protein
MRKFFSKLSDASYRLSAAVTLGSFSFIGAAHAQGSGIGNMANVVNGNVGGVGKLLLDGSFLGGLGLAGAGLMNLKKAADSQGRESYGPGMWRCAIGAGLVALPTFSQTFRDTFTGGTGASLNVQTATFQ